MSQTWRTHDEDSNVQQHFAYLDKTEKVGDWLLAIFGIAILLLLIVGGVVLLS